MFVITVAAAVLGADLYATGSVSQPARYYRLSTVDASLELITENPDYCTMFEFALGPDGHHYGVANCSLGLEVADPATGISQYIACLCAQQWPTGALTVTPEGDVHIGMSGFTPPIQTWNVYTGDWTWIVYNNDTSFRALQWRDDGMLLGADGSGVFFEVDTTIGHIQQLRPADPSLGDIVSFARDPETGTTYMLAGDLGGQTSLYEIDPYTTEHTFIGDLPPNISVTAIAAIPRCDADVNGDGQADVLDFVAFQTAWQGQDPMADCDASGTFDVLDFVCFSFVYSLGCP